MQAWRSSPYQAVGIYLSGRNRACTQPELTAAWARDVTEMGWKLLPINMGSQAPCRDNKRKVPMKAKTAAATGTAEAAAAVLAAKNLGLLPGTPIFADVEPYNSKPAQVRARGRGLPQRLDPRTAPPGLPVRDVRHARLRPDGRHQAVRLDHLRAPGRRVVRPLGPLPLAQGLGQHPGQPLVEVAARQAVPRRPPRDARRCHHAHRLRLGRRPGRYRGPDLPGHQRGAAELPALHRTARPRPSGRPNRAPRSPSSARSPARPRPARRCGTSSSTAATSPTRTWGPAPASRCRRVSTPSRWSPRVARSPAPDRRPPSPPRRSSPSARWPGSPAPTPRAPGCSCTTGLYVSTKDLAAFRAPLQHC